MNLKELISQYLIEENAKAKQNLAKTIKEETKNKIDKMKIDPKNKSSTEEKQKIDAIKQEFIESLPLLDKQFYNDNLDFIIHISFIMNTQNNDLYFTYKTNEKKNFDEIKITNLLELQIQILKKVIAWGSKKEAVIFLNDVSELNIKNSEISMTLCEMYNQIIPGLEKKELFLNEILPQILKNIQISLEKWGKNYFKSDSYRKTTKFYQDYEINLQEFLKKFLQMLKTLPEVQKVSGIGNSKLLTISDLIDESADSVEVLNKSADSNLLIKHYIILFLCDIYEGSLHTEKAFQEKTIDNIQQYILDSLLELHKSPMDYVENMVEQLSYFDYQTQGNRDAFKAYQPLNKYNVTAPAKFLVNLFKNKTVTLSLTPYYQFKLLFSITNEMFLMPEKADQKLELVECLLERLKQHKLQDIDNLNYFNTRIDTVLSSILDFIGGIETGNEKQQRLLDIFPLIWDALTKSAQYEFIIKLIPKTENIQMIGFFINKIYQEISFELRDPSKAFLHLDNPFLLQNPLEYFLIACFQKHYEYSILQRNEIIQNIFNLMYFIMKKHLTLLENNNEDINKQEFAEHILHVQAKEQYLNWINKIKEFEQKLDNEIDQYNNSEKEESILAKNSLMLLKDIINKISEIANQLK